MITLSALLHLRADADFTSALSTSELENHIREIDERLGTLAQIRMRSDIGAVGYRSETDHFDVIELTFDQEAVVDQIVVVPVIHSNPSDGFMPFCFPVKFDLELFDRNGIPIKTVARYQRAENELAGIAPLIFPFPPTKAAGIRINITQFSIRELDKIPALELSEVMVFEGNVNVALGCQVKTTSNPARWSRHRRPEFLVDGAVPYMMDCPGDKSSAGTISNSAVDFQQSYTVDLGAIYPIDRIQLHALEQSTSVPSPFAGDMGIPRLIRIEASLLPDFSDSIMIAEKEHRSHYQTNPILFYQFEETKARYIKLIAVEPYIHDTGKLRRVGGERLSRARTGFAEAQVFSGSENVAFGKKVSANFIHSPTNWRRSLSALTDGLNYYGRIIPIREWMSQLAERHQLETNRPHLLAELNNRYAQQKAHLKLLGWLLLLCILLVFFAILIGHITRLREIAKLKESFAADMHDELGANIHVIGLLADMAKDAIDSPDELVDAVDEIRAATERTSSSIRNYTKKQFGISEGMLLQEIERNASRILAGVDYTVHVDGERYVESIDTHRQMNLLLFLKECMVNVSRHSSATKCDIRLRCDDKRTDLSVTDNGKGMEGTPTRDLPPSLKRRAKILRGAAKVTSSESTGTCVTLSMKTHRWSIFN
ncbi:hypothetical protein G0Q06_06345 [Puniceicoccales bacterium CK1056]|uniref:histidine kinase n=1 Tax=Oceanipulchritudo coccoides TaxID=2706888 RepID=A0A6B2M2Y4_9BACT|nr:histidine kinase [Oceanipulchritudo coccoides]NDV62060.1 hypothetical protein [Oceanipulchritudo coccoides]